jgi:hypothetical protein
MIKFEDLQKHIEEKQEFDKIFDQLENLLGGCLYEGKIVQLYYNTFDRLILTNFTDEGSDLIFDWLYEPYRLDKLNIESLQDLWNYLSSHNMIV